MKSRLVGVPELSAYLGVTPSFIYARTRAGAADPIPAYRLGGVLRFDLVEIDKWLIDHRTESPAEWSPSITVAKEFS